MVRGGSEVIFPCLTEEPHEFTAYLVARYARNAEMYVYARDLQKVNIGVTSSWVLGDHEDRSEGKSNTSFWLRYFGEEDYNDVLNANVFVTFSEHPGAPGRQRGGRHVEFGIALALDKPIIVIGPQENIFHHLPQITHVETWIEALELLKEWKITQPWR
jgi:hypothetical protein